MLEEMLEDITNSFSSFLIKFTTLFGLLAVEMAESASKCVSLSLGVAFFILGLFFVWKSFYKMRIESAK